MFSHVHHLSFGLSDARSIQDPIGPLQDESSFFVFAFAASSQSQTWSVQISGLFTDYWLLKAVIATISVGAICLPWSQKALSKAHPPSLWNLLMYVTLQSCLSKSLTQLSVCFKLLSSCSAKVSALLCFSTDCWLFSWNSPAALSILYLVSSHSFPFVSFAHLTASIKQNGCQRYFPLLLPWNCWNLRFNCLVDRLCCQCCLLPRRGALRGLLWLPSPVWSDQLAAWLVWWFLGGRAA